MGLSGRGVAFACVLVCAACSFKSLDDLKANASVDGGASGASGTGGGSAGSGASLPLGALCAANATCQSGHCAAGICCDTACDSPCVACAAAAKESGEKDGTCGPAKAGTDPRGDCDEEAPSTCGNDGKCDGAGACEKHPAGTLCSDTTCSGGVKTLPKLCDGAGQCVASGSEQCQPASCAGNVCSGDCANDASCKSGEYCDLLTGDCVAKVDLGQTCSQPSQCGSGFCVDGSCCESACTGACQACNGSLTLAPSGTCAPVVAGTDPDDDCADEGAASCGNDGKCDGSGACRKYGPTAVCAAATCSGSTQTNAKTCDGQGNCGGNGTTGCSPYLCNGATCGSSCSADNQCVNGSFCSSSTCEGKKSNGASCGSAQECTSGHCVDGVCCNTACTASCQACSAAKKGAGANGTCGNVVAGQDPDNDCAQEAASTCGKDGTCNGSGGCRLWPGGTVCTLGNCKLDPANNFTYLQTNPDTCNGTGTCVDKGTVQCGLLVCGGSQCKTSCATTADCVLGDCIAGTCYFNPPI
ncbi:MAG: hypothetical protein KC776_07205 [Myxococcales bacterium]|nr:hypothetical protein [Myxococcales bacterium]MCB9582264.1 hypothetical protein [Polyangiaceae bacterium]